MHQSSVPPEQAEGDVIEPDDAIRSVVLRLARPHRSGGQVIERAAILAEGPSSAAVLRWIADHHGVPEAVEPATASGGLHGSRSAPPAREPSRYVLPAGVLSR